MDNKDMLVSTFDSNLYYLSYTSSGYDVESRFRFQRPDALQSDTYDSRFVRPSVLSIGEKYVYFTSVNEDYPYRIPLDKIIP